MQAGSRDWRPSWNRPGSGDAWRDALDVDKEDE
jgi:hypothetical protein